MENFFRSPYFTKMADEYKAKYDPILGSNRKNIETLHEVSNMLIETYKNLLKNYSIADHPTYFDGNNKIDGFQFYNTTLSQINEVARTAIKANLTAFELLNSRLVEHIEEIRGFMTKNKEHNHEHQDHNEHSHCKNDHNFHNENHTSGEHCHSKHEKHHENIAHDESHLKQ